MSQVFHFFSQASHSHTHTPTSARTSRLCVCADHIHGVLTLPQFRAGSLRFLKGSSQSLLGGGNATASAVPQLIQETLATHQLVRKTGAFKKLLAKYVLLKALGTIARARHDRTFHRQHKSESKKV